MKLSKCVCILFVLLTGISVDAEVTLPNMFGDHQVLQREMAVPVWGWAAPGENVTVTFHGHSKSVKTDENGRWMLRLPAMKADAVGKDLVIKGENEIVFKDVVVGEVWLCSGQSNMDWQIRAYPALIEEGKAVNNPNVRFLRVRHYESLFPCDDIQAEQPWSTFQNQQAIFCSAVAYYFGLQLQKKLDIPIGLLDAAWSGTTIDFWIPPDGWKAVPELNGYYKNNYQDLKIVNEKIASYLDFVDGNHSANTSSWIPPKKGPSTHILRQSAMFNGLIAPLAPYGIRGLIWYQGETNAPEGHHYYFKQHGLIKSWRDRWNQGDFPFYFVQLANHMPINEDPEGDVKGWPKLRDAQTKSLDIVNSGMACTIDIGDAKEAHFENKFDVGERLARWALAKDYGRKEIVYSGPIYKEMKIENNQIHLFFDYIGQGLMIGVKNGRNPTAEETNGTLKRFAVAGEDQKWVWAEAKIDGDTVIVSSPEIKKPVAVRYAWSNNPEGRNLYNKNGLPAVPFRTDSW